MKNGILIDWASAGALLAIADANEQSAFCKSFVKELRTWPTRHQQEMQLVFVNEKLTADEREAFATIGYKGGAE